MIRVFFVCLVLLQCIHTPTTLFAQGKKGGGGTTPLPSIRFNVQFLGNLLGGNRSSFGGMNQAADIVGASTDSAGVGRAVRFTTEGVPVDLNVEMADLLAARIDGPWLARTAVNINDLGQIVGTIKVLPDVGFTHTFFYDPGNALQGRPSTLNILPLVRGTTTRPVAINNWGQIAGNYFPPNLAGSFVYSQGGVPIDMGTDISAKGMNDLGQVVFAKSGYVSLRYTPTFLLGDLGTYEIFPFFCNHNSINSSGVLVGYKEVLLRRNTYENTAYRAATPGPGLVLHRSTTSLGTLCINDDSDAIVTIGGRSSLYTDMNAMGLINLDNLVVGTPAALTKWREHFTMVRAMTNRYPVSATSSYPVMSGDAGLPSQAFVLVPQLP